MGSIGPSHSHAEQAQHQHQRQRRRNWHLHVATPSVILAGGEMTRLMRSQGPTIHVANRLARGAEASIPRGIPDLPRGRSVLRHHTK